MTFLYVLVPPSAVYGCTGLAQALLGENNMPLFEKSDCLTQLCIVGSLNLLDGWICGLLHYWVLRLFDVLIIGCRMLGTVACHMFGTFGYLLIGASQL